MTDGQINTISVLMLAFSGRERPTLEAAESVVREVIAESPYFRAPQAISWRDAEYHDSTPLLSVGDSSFEDWYQAHPHAREPVQNKQLARDAYAAGMRDDAGPFTAKEMNINWGAGYNKGFDDGKVAAAPAAPAQPPVSPAWGGTPCCVTCGQPWPPLQTRVQPWLMACFGAEIAADKTERNHRFLEESLETVQACGCTQSEAHQLVDYVYGRPVGDPPQEVGGVMITLAALCLAHGLDMHQAGEAELARIWTMVEKIRAKQAAKPKHSPLPGPSAIPQAKG